MTMGTWAMQFVGGPFSGEIRAVPGGDIPPEYYQGIAFPQGPLIWSPENPVPQVTIEQVRYVLQGVYVGPGEGCEGPGRYGWVYVLEESVGDNRLVDLAGRRAAFAPVQP